MLHPLAAGGGGGEAGERRRLHHGVPAGLRHSAGGAGGDGVGGAETEDRHRAGPHQEANSADPRRGYQVRGHGVHSPTSHGIPLCRDVVNIIRCRQVSGRSTIYK